MRVAVTGASGFIGRRVVEHLLTKGHKVISVGRTDPKIDGVEHKNWGVQKKVNVVVHCAAASSDWNPSKEAGDTLSDTNLALTGAALDINPKARFILMSSASVYQTSGDGFHTVEELVADETPMLNAYSASKALSEHLTASERPDGDFYILRPRAVYGAGDTTLLPRLEEYAQGYFILPGKEPVGSFTNIKTLCEVVEFFVDDYAGAKFGIYNVADRKAVDTHQLIVDLMEKRGHVAKPFRLPYKIAYKSAETMENKARKKGTEPLATRYLVSQIGRDSAMNVEKLENAMGRELPETDISDAASW